MSEQKTISAAPAGAPADHQPADSPYLEAAMVIAQQLAQEALPGAPGLTWEGDDAVGDVEHYTIVCGRVGADLYGGASGIAWFLGHIAPLDSSGALAAAAVGGLKFALAAARDGLNAGAYSLMSGSTGVALATLEVADRLQLPGLRRSALALARQTCRMLSRAPLQHTDLVSGMAGAIIGLLAIHRRSGEQYLLDACRQACEQLLGSKRSEWWGSSWPESDDAPALCGLAHGMSGIGWALAETAWATGEERFLDAAQEAFRYERSWYSPERCGWPDLRVYGNERAIGDGTWPGWMTAWCHGALGIGAVRLRLYEMCGDTTALAEASAAIQAARLMVMRAGADLHRGYLSDTTLCHGLGGAAELFLLAYEILGGKDHQRAARQVGRLCLDIYKTNDRHWTCGLRDAQHVPGLFLGMAGIGVTLLRLHDESCIGSPLLAGHLPASPVRTGVSQAGASRAGASPAPTG